MYASYSLGMEGEAIKSKKAHFVVQSSESTETYSRVCREWRWRTIQPQCHVCCFHSPFHISSALLIGYLQNWLFAKWSSHSHYLSMLALTCPLVEYFASHTPNFEQCASYQGCRQIFSRRQYVPNKLCALNNNVRLITRSTVYAIIICYYSTV